MQDVSEESRTLLVALRAAVQSTADAERPGRLRRLLEEALGPEDSVRLRRVVHQVVAAAEENVPHDLRRITPLTSQSLQRLADDLAVARGWNHETARRTVQLWAAALGFGDLAASSWPREPQVTSGRSVPAEATLLPPGNPFVPAGRAERSDSAPSSAPAPAPAPPTTAPAPAWPAPRKGFATTHAATRSGESALGVTLAYAGMSLPLGVAAIVLLTVVLCLPILLVGASGVLLPLLGVMGAKLVVSRLARGALIASAGGVEFVPYDTSLRKPRPEQAFAAPWSQVQVETGNVSRLAFAGRRVQLGPRNRAFADAAAAMAEGLQ